MCQALSDTLRLGAHDILLDQLLELIAATPGDLETLFQAAVFTVPVEISGIAFALANAQEPISEQITQAAHSLQRLSEMSLVTPLDENKIWVHRWTAENLKTRSQAHSGSDAFRDHCRRAGEYLLWRMGHVSHALTDGTEAVRSFLDAAAFDQAATRYSE